MVQVIASVKQGVTFRASLTASRVGTTIDLTSVPVESAVRTQDGFQTYNGASLVVTGNVAW